MPVDYLRARRSNKRAKPVNSRLRYDPAYFARMGAKAPTGIWPMFGPGRAGAANDSSPHAYDGTLEGDAAWKPSSAGMAVRGTSTGYIQTALTGTQNQSPRSMGVWFIAASTANQTAGLIGQVYSGSPQYGQFTLFIAGDSLGNSAGTKLVINDNTNFGGTGGGRDIIGTTNVCDGKLHFGCAVRDGTATRLYVDGKQQASDSTALDSTAGSSANFLIGAFGNGSGGGGTTAGWYFNGWIPQSFNIPGYALTAAQVYKLWRDPWGMFPEWSHYLLGVSGAAPTTKFPWQLFTSFRAA